MCRREQDAGGQREQADYESAVTQDAKGWNKIHIAPRQGAD